RPRADAVRTRLHPARGTGRTRVTASLRPPLRGTQGGTRSVPRPPATPKRTLRRSSCEPDDAHCQAGWRPAWRERRDRAAMGGPLPAIRLPGGAIRYREDELNGWLEQRVTGAEPRGGDSQPGVRAQAGGYSTASRNAVLSEATANPPPTAATTEED